jgi:hypothetical protein
MNTMLASMGQMFDSFQRMQQQLHQQQPGQAAQPPPVYAPPQPTYAAPQPAGSDMGATMAMMQQMFDMFRRMQPAPAAPAAPAPPSRGGPQQPQQPQQPQMPDPMAMAMMGMPPMQPPPGTIWVPGFGFVPLEKLAQVVSGQAGVGVGGPPYRGPYRPPGGPPPYQGGPPPYTPGGPPYRDGGPPPWGPPPQREKTPAEQFREALTVVRTAVEAVQDINEMLPNAQGAPNAQEPNDDDDSPIKIMETGVGRMKIAVGKDDGRLRWAETGMMALPDVLKWVGEQREAIQKAHAEQRQQEQRVLPPGYVEVGPGYQPPPGYVAVPVEAQPQIQPQQPVQQPLPPPPAEVPPPIQPRRTWSAPTIPGEGE